MSDRSMNDLENKDLLKPHHLCSCRKHPIDTLVTMAKKSEGRPKYEDLRLKTQTILNLISCLILCCDSRLQLRIVTCLLQRELQFEKFIRAFGSSFRGRSKSHS